jgi:vitamin K-dependent gamma-carboxylase
VEPLSGQGMHALVALLAVLAFAMAVGFAFRLSAFLFALGFTYLQLIDVSIYLNHYYLAALLAGLLCISPAARAWSVDAFLARKLGRPARPAECAAAWLYLFRFQVGVVYFFAGMAKAQPDWLLHAQPLRIWLGASAELPILGPLLAIDAVPLFMSWAGFLFDTTIAGWLSFSKTRPYAYAVVIVFHTLTRLLFPIGMFPVIMVLSALVFFTPSWPRTLIGRVFRQVKAFTPSLEAPQPKAAVWQRALLAVAGVYCFVQLVMPVRFLVYGGNVLWHEQGMRFSWRVMVRAKGGSTTFVVRNKLTGRTWHVSPDEYLTPLQEAEMSSQPDLILQLAHHIRDDAERRGLGPVEVRVESLVSLNGRRSTFLIDPNVDLAQVTDGITPQKWVTPAPSVPPPHTKVVL